MLLLLLLLLFLFSLFWMLLLLLFLLLTLATIAIGLLGVLGAGRRDHFQVIMVRGFDGVGVNFFGIPVHVNVVDMLVRYVYVDTILPHPIPSL